MNTDHTTPIGSAKPTIKPAKTVIGVATFRRDALLITLLNALVPQASRIGAKVVVVDNDPDQSARWVPSRFPPSQGVVTLLRQPEPGIAAARNAAVEFAIGSDAICFIDDDEVPHDRWLETLIAHANRSGADVVVGPVEPVLPTPCPRWIRASNAFNRPRAESGTDVKWPATNNVLIRTDAFNLLSDPRFSPEFSLTGGSDAELFWRLRRGGATFSWCDEAVVTEDVPRSRATFKWIWRRGIRLGNVSARLLLRDKPRWQVLVIGLARVPAGCILGPWGLVRHRSLLQFMHTPKGLGMIQATRGNLTVEYKRA